MKLNRIVSPLLRGHTASTRLYATQPNFKKKTLEFIKDLKRTDVPIKEMDLDLINFKNDVTKTKAMIDAHLQNGEFALLGDDVIDMVREALKQDRTVTASDALLEIEEQNKLKKRINFEKVYDGIKLVHLQCNRGGRQTDVVRLIDPLLSSNSDFPSLYLLPVHLAKVLDLYRRGDKEDCLRQLADLRSTLKSMYTATKEKIEQNRLKFIALTAVTEEERRERNRIERSKLHLYEQTLLPAERFISNYTYSPLNEKIPEYDSVFGIEQDLQHVLKHLSSFLDFERCMYYEVSQQLESLDVILNNVEQKGTLEYYMANGHKANVLALQGKHQESLQYFETCVNGLKQHPDKNTLRTIWQVMHWRAQYELGLRDASQDIINIVQMVDPNYAKNVNQYKKLSKGNLSDGVTRWLCLQLTDILISRGRAAQALTFIERGLELSFENGTFSALYPHFLSRKAHALTFGIKLSQDYGSQDEQVEKLFEKSLYIQKLQSDSSQGDVSLADAYLRFLENRRASSPKIEELKKIVGEGSENVRNEQAFSIMFGDVVLPYTDAPVLFDK
ncbi:cep63 [Acrasis kona]|uniref:Cep63 n=1 Tax=Acrasis kona TaxID=1008807 RepID=A0AAW2Z7N7_9EUKA